MSGITRAAGGGPASSRARRRASPAAVNFFFFFLDLLLLMDRSESAERVRAMLSHHSREAAAVAARYSTISMT